MERTKDALSRPTQGTTGVAEQAIGASGGIVDELRRREGDELLQLPAISELTTLSEPTLRWLRHRGEGPPMFKLHRRLVAWKGDVLRWLAEQAAKDAEARSA